MNIRCSNCGAVHSLDALIADAEAYLKEHFDKEYYVPVKESCAQEKVLAKEKYQKRVEEGIIPVVKGHILNEEDLKLRRHILNLMCQLETTFTPENSFEELPEALKKLQEMQEDGLVEISGNTVKITEKGRVFTRNVAMAFDLRMMRKMPETRLFSMTV